MSHTDRAFIAALQQASAAAPPNGFALGGPHYVSAQSVETTAKAPLSAHLAKRRAERQQPEPPKVDPPAAQPAVACPPERFTPGIELESLSWPAVAQQLAHAGRDALLEVLTNLAEQTPSATPVVALVGARPGVGATTTLLALARIVGGAGGKTAILDLTAEAGAAAQLGVRRIAGVSPTFDPRSIDDLAIVSREDQTTVVALGPDASPAIVQSASTRLAGAHDLVLIDAGPAAVAATRLGLGVMAVVIDAAPSDSTAIAACQKALAAVGVAGIVETFAAVG
ncbi:hypothetical protein Pla108_27870 [Botrimarina colliarenosi]|uniref:Uncharacterized protein n=1 Tax=Botrimarina colliarenosi TaxID=2528001 RepID=A0A5C6AC66_9BACT|nr:hypothetical protein [Botrimarina colliarenosi]TWT97010.1 hypothetical protein Pla108_27870 [Botrimarina colliarenosi]